MQVRGHAQGSTPARPNFLRQSAIKQFVRRPQGSERRVSPEPTFGDSRLRSSMAFNRGDTAFCSACGQSITASARFCSRCGAAQSTAPPNDPPRHCPFCRVSVDPLAVRCPHCSAEIGRLQDCSPCPHCHEMVRPAPVVATDESGRATGFFKNVLGGQYYLSNSDETYYGCPSAVTPWRTVRTANG